MDVKLIQSDPSIMMGKPVVTGTRITVELVLEKLAAGETVEQLLEAHPRLTKEGVQAAISFDTDRSVACRCHLSNCQASGMNLPSMWHKTTRN